MTALPKAAPAILAVAKASLARKQTHAHLLQHALVPLLIIHALICKGCLLLLRLRVRQRQLLPTGSGCKGRHTQRARWHLLTRLQLLPLLLPPQVVIVLNIHPRIHPAVCTLPNVTQRGLRLALLLHCALLLPLLPACLPHVLDRLPLLCLLLLEVLPLLLVIVKAHKQAASCRTAWARRMQVELQCGAPLRQERLALQGAPVGGCEQERQQGSGVVCWSWQQRWMLQSCSGGAGEHRRKRSGTH